MIHDARRRTTVADVLPGLSEWHRVHGDLPRSTKAQSRNVAPILPSYHAILTAFNTDDWSHAMRMAASLLDIHGGQYGLPVDDDAKLLDWSRPVLRQQVRRQLARRVQTRTIHVSARQRPAAQFDCRKHLRGPCAADARNAPPEVGDAGARQPMQAAALLEHGISQLQHVASAGTAA